MNEIILKSPFEQLWLQKDPFTEVELISGKVYRAVKQRKTLNFQLEGESYFIKIHRGTTIKEIVKNLISLRLPVLDAKQEWDAIHRLEQAGVNTMDGRAFGRKGLNPLTRHSFIITKDLNPTISLEDFTKSWITHPPSYNLKRSLIIYLANMTAKMHAAGVNHRDCYLCHFLLDIPLFENNQQIKLSVIDLHRAQTRDKVPTRWRDKDLIGLYFSSAKIGLTNRDIWRFLKVYFNKPLKTILRDEHKLITSAQQKAERISKRTKKYQL
ncbi:Lipopolysaccharide core biosynthesis protein WaaP, heptosyl-I-kinase [Gilliamella apicola]|uniref:lipopolysaccharide core heptose(I) kinase RfaP n=1 Tax=Gilliamella apicola TaxID=1196095 RepID=UPI00042F3580|nr:lipopolysaccharide core heptose(I) kinase RfaP [Gilliamella apicola]AHN25136.1 Lipopolysaccharide core biosynthesis protein WaaP, heptosyl-I-kinase [Gilliamella apicola]PXV96431.1 heptose I phosphotransferase [Gilliamella apicola]PXZ02292.1 lipopolysaccharide core heptose(I) kinase RfaP [Gilliamella apicola]WLS91239.1 lipopolysaccharide core heptose(I) kinase RfaP [Gilliamella apicola]